MKSAPINGKDPEILSSASDMLPESLEGFLGRSKTLAKRWCRMQDSNSRPTDYKSVALPAELIRRPLKLISYMFEKTKLKNAAN